MIPKSSMEIITIFEYSINTKTQDADFKFFMRIDIGKFLDDFLKFPELKILGISKDYIWDIFAMAFSSMDELSGYNVVVKKYYFEFSLNGKNDELVNDSSQGQILLNSNKNKMKWLFNSDISFDLGDDGFRELILYKM
jgi:hypothetical protein